MTTWYSKDAPPREKPPPVKPRLEGIEGPKATLEVLQEADDDTLLALDPKRLTRLESRVQGYLEDEAKGFPFLRDHRWTLCFRRAFLVMEHREKKLARSGATLGSPRQRMLGAALVADYHAWRWADDEAKDRKDWPDRRMLLASWGVEADRLAVARQQARHHSWEKRYLLGEHVEVRKETLIRQAMKNVLDADGEAPKDRNPGMIRAAAELLGIGKAGVQIHNGPSQTINILPGGDFEERVRRLQDVAQRMLNQEVPREVESHEVPAEPEEAPRGEDRRPPEDGPADSRGTGVPS